MNALYGPFFFQPRFTTNYFYDALQREISRTYSNGDPTVSTTYDAACAGCTNIGHRTGMTDAAGSQTWSYNDASHVVNISRTTISTPTNITQTHSFTFDFLGHPIAVNFPNSGRAMLLSYDGAGRPSILADSQDGSQFVGASLTPPTGCSSAGVCYTPQGTAYSMAIFPVDANGGLNILNTYNNRLQPQRFQAIYNGTTNLDMTYSFVDPTTLKNAGHVWSITNNLNSNRSQKFSYDQLNRISSAGTIATSGTFCWGYQYSYDAWGNLLSQAGWSPTYNGCSQTVMSTVTADGSNHISGLTYDTAGDTLTDGANTYTWNGDGDLKTAAGVTYRYDGDGNRVAKSNGTLYWYGLHGEVLDETDAAGNVTATYYYFLGKRVVAEMSFSNRLFYAEDFLGSSRAIAKQGTGLCYDADFTPFGGERAYTNTCSQRYKFEGKERDAETGNDDFGARYYSNRMGRWLNSDWSAIPVPVPYANLTNPQTLNLYSMVADDPETFADLDGHCCVLEGAVAGAEIGEFLGPVGEVLGAVGGALAGAFIADKAADYILSNPTSGPQTNSTEVGGYLGEKLGQQLATQYQKTNGQTQNSGNQAPAPAQSPSAEPSAGSTGQGLPKPPIGKGSVPPDQRDPKRLWTKAERQQKLDQQNGKCAQCGKDKTVDETRGHHKDRHADGGRTNDANHAEVCKDCHKDLHSN